MKNSLYDRDFYAWANEQAGLLRAGRIAEADIENIAEEIETMGRSERRELINRLTVLLLHLLKWQFLTAAWVIVFAAIGTFILLNIVKLFVPLRMTEQEMEEGDLAVHGHEVYPSDVPSLGFPQGIPAVVTEGTA